MFFSPTFDKIVVFADQVGQSGMFVFLIDRPLIVRLLRTTILSYSPTHGNWQVPNLFWHMKNIISGRPIRKRNDFISRLISLPYLNIIYYKIRSKRRNKLPISRPISLPYLHILCYNNILPKRWYKLLICQIYIFFHYNSTHTVECYSTKNKVHQCWLSWIRSGGQGAKPPVRGWMP